ncbi:50S ribosomal protein L35 [Mycoplasmopsis fermentans]|uniref:Large ribosomal subunit protein bL35 n=3 Tax=Mycoplasmopsis fermentans TaxID=2115 RepID=RL35_MYCFE|nr:50S ribosomal protein L35 [Mycoplasmopsis fermentans]Q05428.3 RecName: Full=Large ribosomal subunit protein bL35; AltName: Full=50S ribosomal protein L35 [Mycoplasmopsis fermentans]VEU67520.1 50S ribosomal protein l35 [Mesomycoplasma conjunctivae]AAA25414.1 ribosomal protein L35 [Mycoplasmopsis fermentans]ADV34355.1 50S ribosomal protein L35 [Mycoplasmopsis fermentans M64]RMX35765.1 ribosomal protein L35 [Mycoplasmopsis fermentans MF-I2]RMX35784.1 ribosomal protein L35 [Mycoplasmopsis ferm
MPKMKTKSALKKRIKITGTGKIMREQAYRSHLSQNKTTKQKRQARKSVQMHSSDVKRFKALI